MPDFIGNIEVPEIVASGTYPLTPDYGSVRAIEPEIAIHAFGSANAKIEQRFYLGNGVRRFRLSHSQLTRADVVTLRDFFDANSGPEGAFTFDFPEPDGSTTAYTCHFEGQGLSFGRDSNTKASAQVDLAGIPSSAPTYTLNSTETRFPGVSLNAALLAQVQEVIPLIKITTRESGYPVIYLSDRRCTVGAQLYQARLLSWDGIEQGMGGDSDQAKFAFGNADRVMRDLAADTNLWRADIEFSLFHVGTGIKLDFWKGFIVDFGGGETTEFSIAASDGAYELSLQYPPRRISRTGWKKFNDGVACPAATAGGTNLGTPCDKGFDTPAGCVFHNMQDYHCGINVRPQGVRIKDNGSGTWGFGRNLITSTSLASDSIYGLPLQEIYTDAELTVNCQIAAGREESDFYAAIGIVGAGPIGAYAADGSKHRLDGQAAHGPLPLGLRRSLGHDPVQDNDPDPDSHEFSIDGGTFTGDRAAGVAFLQIRRSDPKGFQPSRVTDHQMQAVISGGMGGWYWTDPSTRLWATSNTQPVWIAVNFLLRAKGMENASAAAQVELFDVAAAIAVGATCANVVPVVVGSGTETQFQFRGVIADPKPLRDWLQEILNNFLGYYSWAFGKLKIGMRYNSSAAQAFTVGNILLDSLRLTSLQPAFNELSAQFADAEFDYAANTVGIYDEGHQAVYGKSASTINLVGTFTKSQAARIVTTRLREEMGGITEAEWKAARRGSFRTTILGLSVEPGMVCSLTHADMPGGAGEFRVQRVVLNEDWSVDIEFKSTTDSMYDLTIGDKPADVTADAVPDERVIDLVPGDIQAIGANDFNVTQSDDGISVYFDIEYSPPGTDSTDIGTFAGISAWIEAPDASGALFFTGNHDYNGDPDGVGAARYGTARLVLPLPVAGEDWRILIASKSLVYTKPIVLTGASATPSMVVTVGDQSIPGGGTPPPQIAEATLSVAIPEYRTDLDGQQWAKIVISYTSPGGTPADAYPGAWIYDDAAGAPDPATTPALDGSPWYATAMGQDIEFWMKREDANLTYWARVTVNTTSLTVLPVAASPKVTFTITKYADAPQVTGFNVTVATETRKGVPSGRFVYAFTPPADPEFWYASIERIRTDSSFVPLVGAEWARVAGDPLAGLPTDFWPLPTAAEYWTFRCRSVNQAGDENSTSAPSVNVTVPASGGLNLAQSDAATIGTGLGISGGTLRIPDAAVITALLADLAVSDAKIAAAAVTTAKIANLAVDNGKLAALAVDAAKLATGAVTTTKLGALAVDAAALATSAVTSTKIANAAVGNAAIANLAVATGQIQDAAITSAKIGSAAVGTAAIANLAVGTAQIADAAIVTAKIGNLAVTTALIADAAIVNAKIGSLAVATANIQDAAITNAKIDTLNVSKLTVGTMSIGSGNVVFNGTGSLQVTGGGGISSGNVLGAIFSVSSIQTVGAVSIIDSSRNTNFNNMKYTGQFWGPFVADTGLSFASSAGKIACYDTSGVFKGWIPVLP